MTQRDLALATGYSIGQICRFEQNQCVPDLPTLTARFIPALVQASDTATTERLLAFADIARAAPRRPPPLRLASEEPGVALDLALALPALPIPATPLLGRAHDVAQVCALLQQASVRLLTLTGAPGIGKTRLGLQVAADLHASFPDGVIFIALAPISDPALVITTIAHALGVQERAGQALQDILKGFLRKKRLLLLLDNFEQVIVAAPLVGELLAAASGLKVLATSRRRLHLSGEHEFAVAPLALPPRGKAARGAAHIAVDTTSSALMLSPAGFSAADLTQYAAVQLFIARAQAVKADFVVTDATAAAIAEICHRLDGLPLAIELAAARVKLLSPQALVSWLERRFHILTAGPQDLPVRQQTLRTTIDWSYQLLDVGQQRLLACLGVFVGGWTLEAAKAVCTVAGDLQPDVLDQMALLVDQSLVQQDEGLDGEPRFTMLETIREYALERLEMSGEVEIIRQQHAAYFLAWAEVASPEMRGPQVLDWIARLEHEHDNLRVALRWFQDTPGHTDEQVQLVGALWDFWLFHGHIHEGRASLHAAIEPESGPGAASASARARALFGAGVLAWHLGDLAVAETYAAASAALYRQLNDGWMLATALGMLGLSIVMQSQGAQGWHPLAESLTLARTYIHGRSG
jgi:predicted ATPase